MEGDTPSTQAAPLPSPTVDAPAGERRNHRPSSIGPAGGARSEGTTGSVGVILPSRAHVLLGIGGAQAASGSNDRGSPSKRLRKERGLNWSTDEVKALIEAKREVHELEKRTTNPRALMNPDSGKWQRISGLVMQVGASPCLRDGTACKSKWNQLIADYKKIADYVKRTASEDASFWHLSFARRRQEGLPQSYPQDVFWRIHEWYREKSAMLPTHSRDLMEPTDTSFQSARSGSEDVQILDGSDNDVLAHEGHDLLGTDNDSINACTESASTFPASSRGHPLDTQNMSSPMSTPPPTRRTTLSAGVEPFVISSSEAGSLAAADRPPNTGVRRKSLSGHTLIAESTKIAGESLTAQLRAATDVTRDIEKSKMDMQMQQFDQRMSYQRDKDSRFKDTATKKEENAKLSIAKQSEIVMALSAMTSVFRQAFLPRDGYDRAVGEEGGHSHFPSTDSRGGPHA